MKKRSTFALLLVMGCGLLVTACHKSQGKAAKVEPANAALSKAVTEQLEADHFQGTALIIRKQKVVATARVGYRNQEKKKRNQLSTSFPIASIQKLVTASLIEQEVAAHKLSYQDAVRKYLPESQAPQDVTIRQLMEHQSGLRMDEVAPAKILTTQKQQEQFIFQTMTWTTDKSYNYSNANYSLLAAILTKVTNKPYQKLVQQRIITALHLKDTYFWDAKKQQSAFPVAYEYQALNGESQVTDDNFQDNQALFSSLLGAGNLLMSSGDLATFILSLQNGKLLSAKQYQEMTEDIDSGYNSGFWVSEKKATALGELGGYQAIVYGPKGFKNAVILLANQVGTTDLTTVAPGIEALEEK